VYKQLQKGMQDRGSTKWCWNCLHFSLVFRWSSWNIPRLEVGVAKTK